MDILILDTETTNLPNKEGKVIEVGAILFSIDHRDIISQLSYLIPTDNNDMESCNHIKVELTQCCKNYNEYSKLLYKMSEQATFYMAHNSSFDKQFFKYSESDEDPNKVLLAQRKWICSYEDMNWSVTKKLLKLSDLALLYGIPVWSCHRALSDCIYIAEILKREPNLENTILEALQQKHTYSANIKYNDRQQAKDLGFKWDSELKLWTKNMSESMISSLPFTVSRIE